MPEMRRMDFRFERFLFSILLVLWVLTFCGCLTYQFSRQVEGTAVAEPGDTIRVGMSNIGDVMMIRGAPDRVIELEGRNILIYERALYQQSRLSVGIPFSDIRGPGAELSSYGGLARCDTLTLFFTPSGILEDMVYEKNSVVPFFKILLTTDSQEGS